MDKKRYDIFISYRRCDAGDKAEHLKDLLEPKYKGRVSFDRENLTGLFDVALARRIDRSKDFLLVLGKDSLAFEDEDFLPEQVALYEFLGQCSQEDFENKILSLGPNAPIDFVRIEIVRALHRHELNIIPVVPESSESFNFSKLQLPPDIEGIKRYEAVFYSDSPDALFKDVVPKICKHLRSKPDNALLKRTVWSAVGLLVFLVFFFVSCKLYQNMQEGRARRQLMVKELGEQVFDWNPDITLEQLKAVHDIVGKMEPVVGGTFMMGPPLRTDGTYGDDVEECFETPSVKQTVETFYMGRYEVTVSQWCRIMQLPYDEQETDMPMTNVSLDECLQFCDSLYNLTGLRFSLPTEAEWEYAARGGNEPDNTVYAGSNNVAEVAWYVRNAKKKPNICDATNSGMSCNALNLYDMSGNVSEWCLWVDSLHRLYCDMSEQKITRTDVIYNEGVCIIRGGNYLSEPYELTVYHRDTADRTQKSPNIGLRLIIRKDY